MTTQLHVDTTQLVMTAGRKLALRFMSLFALLFSSLSSCSPKPPGPAADMGDRVKYIAKGMQRELAKEEEVKAKSAREFKGFTAGLEAAKRRQAARAKKND